MKKIFLHFQNLKLCFERHFKVWLQSNSTAHLFLSCIDFPLLTAKDGVILKLDGIFTLNAPVGSLFHSGSA